MLDPPAGPLPEPEIHARIVEALGLLDADGHRGAAGGGGARTATSSPAPSPRRPATDPKLAAVAAVVLYRTLGPTLPHGAAAAAPLWPMAIRCSQVNPDGVARAGFGSGPDAGNRLFDAIVDSPSGVVFTDDTWEATWQRIKTDDGLVHVEIPEAPRRAGRAGQRDTAGGRPSVAAPALRRGTALVHGEHDPA